MPSRSSGSPMNHHHRNLNYRSGVSGGGHPHHHHHPYNGPPNHPPGGDGFQSMGGGGGGSGFGSMPHAGQKRRFHPSGRVGSPDNTDAGGFAKLFIGSVPRTANEEDIRPLFEDHGNVIEVALIKDRRTGQQQGCCFIKYATSEEADRAIRALHNQYTLPGGVGPIQVRYADGERERPAEYKLFVASLNRQATEKEVEEIFLPYGRVEDVYIMRDEKKQSRGCGFVKFSHRDMAACAINGLNGIYVMRGCDQPLAVRFADPKRPRTGESRIGSTFGGPGFGPPSQGPLGVRPGPIHGEPMGGRIPPDAWHPMSPRNLGPSSQTTHGFVSPLVARGGVMPMPSATSGPLETDGCPAKGSLPGLSFLPPSTSQQSFNPSMSQVQPVGQQVSLLQKPLESPHHLFSSTQLHPQQTSAPYSWPQTSLASIQSLGQLQAVYPSGQTSFNQALPSQQFGLSGQMPISQPQVQLSTSSAAVQQMRSNIQPQAMSAAAANQQLLSAPTVQQQMIQPQRQASTQLPQMLSQQTQVLQAGFQASQPAFSQLQQQLPTMQPSSQNLTRQHASQAIKQQPSWTGIMPQMAASAPATASAAVMPSTASTSPLVPASMLAAAPLTCNWTEHTSPEGYKYYYNSVTCESRWEKPEEFTSIEQQQQQRKSSGQQLHAQPQTQSHPQVFSPEEVAQTPQMQIQSQLHHQQLQQPSLSSSAPGMTGQQNVQELSYAQLQVAPSSVIDPAHFQQGLEAAQDWMWKNKPTGS